MYISITIKRSSPGTLSYVHKLLLQPTTDCDETYQYISSQLNAVICCVVEYKFVLVQASAGIRTKGHDQRLTDIRRHPCTPMHLYPNVFACMCVWICLHYNVHVAVLHRSEFPPFTWAL